MTSQFLCITVFLLKFAILTAGAHVNGTMCFVVFMGPFSHLPVGYYRKAWKITVHGIVMQLYCTYTHLKHKGARFTLPYNICITNILLYSEVYLLDKKNINAFE